MEPLSRPSAPPTSIPEFLSAARNAGNCTTKGSFVQRRGWWSGPDGSLSNGRIAIRNGARHDFGSFGAARDDSQGRSGGQLGGGGTGSTASSQPAAHVLTAGALRENR